MQLLSFTCRYCHLHATIVIYMQLLSFPCSYGRSYATTYKWRFQFLLSSVQFVSAVCCTPLRSSLRYVAHCGDHLCSLQHTAEIFSKLGARTLLCVAHSGDCLCGVFIPLGSSPRCATHCWDHLRGMLHITETTLWSNILAKSELNLKKYGFESKNMEVSVV